MAEKKWWEIEDPEERQKAWEEQGSNPYSIKDPEEQRRAWDADWERRKYARAKHRRIVAEGKHCSKCGAEIGDAVYRYKPLLQQDYGGTRWLTMPTVGADPICEGCAPDWLPELRTQVYKLYMYPHTAPCEVCGRAVFFVSGMPEHKGSVFCSDNCKGQSKRNRHVGPREKACEVCGEAFVARRSDAKTCSPGCRQKAYRKRSQVSTANARSSA